MLVPPINRRVFLKRMLPPAALAAAGLYPGVLVHRRVQINHYQLPVARLPKSFIGLRIAQLTDLHYGLGVSLNFIKGLVRRTNDIGADIIVCTGDYVRGRDKPALADAVWPLLAELKAPLGVFAVLGNHDHWTSRERSRYWLTQTGFDIERKAVSIARDGKRLWLAGATDLWEDWEPLDAFLSNIPDNACRIILAHNPDTADMPTGKPVDAVIAGHTHGGQVAFPWIGAPLLPVRNKSYAQGCQRSARGTSVFISRGLGWAILPIRFNCAPEIAVLELAAAADLSTSADTSRNAEAVGQ